MSKQLDVLANTPAVYATSISIGTEEVSQEDLNTPVLKIVQSNTQNIENKKEGFYYRSDTKEQLDAVDVNLVYVTTTEMENYNKTGVEKVKMYYGFYAGTNEPFKMYVRGWGLASHRNFQTEVATIKGKFKVPMLALTVTLTTEAQAGTIAENGKPYKTYKPVFNVVKMEDEPIIELDPERINFLIESANRFKEVAAAPSANDGDQNDLPEFMKV